MKIDHIGHSGFLVETASALLLFDYFRGDLSALGRAPLDKPLFVFVSHAHRDHFNPDIFALSKGGRKVKYILSFDIKGEPSVPRDADVLFADADREYEVAYLGRVRTLLSTDEGVAFLVKTPDASVFHAGDLNFWDWKGEDEAWLSEQERVFGREIGKLAGERIDAAFVVLDDRLEENFAEGAMTFLSVCSPSYLLPMHFRKDKSVVSRLKAMLGRQCDTLILDTANETSWDI